MLRNYRDRHPEGSSLDDTLPEEYVRTLTSRRRADRVIWAGLGRQPDPKTDTATIVVEFLSAGKAAWRRDHISKRDEHLELGVVEYWVVDRFGRCMTVYRQGPSGPQELVIREDQTYTTHLLPGFELSPARLFKVADAWQA